MEKPQGAAQAIDELEEIELQEIDEPSDVATGEFVREGASSQPSPSVAKPANGARSSVPPPVPPEARARRSTPPSLPPSPPPAGASVAPPPRASSSGMYRIEAGRHTTTLPGVAPPPPDVGVLQQRIAVLTTELRELRAQHDRLRLTLRLREDRIRELERAVREHDERRAALEAALARVEAQGTGDDLKRIPGIGPGFERALHAIGITSFSQIAAWTEEDVERVAREIRTVPARIVRGQWIEHARALAAEAPPQVDGE